MVLEELGQNILNLVNYGITVIIILMAIEAWRFFSHGGTAGKVGAGLTDWDKSPVLNFIKKRQGRSKTKLLNEYLEEQKETELLNKAVESVNNALAEVKKIQSAGKINKAERDAFLTVVSDVPTKINAAEKEYRRLNRRTWRSERDMKPIIEKMEDAKMDVGDLQKLEEHILILHKECADEIKVADALYDAEVKPNLDKLKNLNDTQFAAGAGGYLQLPAVIPRARAPASIGKVLDALKVSLAKDEFQLKAAYDKQLEADKEVQGIVSIAKRLWA